MIIENYSLMAEKYPDYMFAKKVVQCAQKIKVERAKDVLPEYMLKYLQIEKPQENQCYKNATNFAQVFPDMITYCEGITDAGLGIPIDHAFNAYTDLEGVKHYIDITLEYVIKEDTRNMEYVLLGEYSFDDIVDILIERGVYGGIWQYKTLQLMKQSK